MYANAPNTSILRARSEGFSRRDWGGECKSNQRRSTFANRKAPNAPRGEKSGTEDDIESTVHRIRQSIEVAASTIGRVSTLTIASWFSDRATDRSCWLEAWRFFSVYCQASRVSRGGIIFPSLGIGITLTVRRRFN